MKPATRCGNAGRSLSRRGGRRAERCTVCGDWALGRSRARPAFTLLETLAALVLATTLMAALTGVLGLLAKQQKLVRTLGGQEWQAQLIEQLRWDLSQATYWQVEPQLITIHGYGALSSRWGRPLQRPAEVRYVSVAVEDATWLVREEREVTAAALPTWRRDLLAPGKWRFGIEDIAGQEIKLPHTGRLPSAVRVYLQRGENETRETLWVEMLR